MALGNMLPFLSENDCGDVRLCESKHVGDVLLANRAAGIHCSNLAHAVLGKFMRVMALASMVSARLFWWARLWKCTIHYPYGVPEIIRLSAPLKIIETIIAFVPVDMISNGLRRVASAKREQHQPMNVHGVNCSVLPQVDTNVLAGFAVRFKDIASRAFLPWFAAHPTKIAGRIKPFVSWDCSPLLCRVTAFVRHFQPFFSRLLVFRRGTRLQPCLAPLFSQ